MAETIVLTKEAQDTKVADPIQIGKDVCEEFAVPMTGRQLRERNATQVLMSQNNIEKGSSEWDAGTKKSKLVGSEFYCQFFGQ